MDQAESETVVHAVCDAEGCKRQGDLRCGSCRCVYYCTASCQKSHWKEHKIDCKRLKLFEAEVSEQKASRTRFLDRYSALHKESLNSECSICYDIISNHPIQLQCSHSFCINCMKRYVETSLNQFDVTCPLCRSNEGRQLTQSIYQTAHLFAARAEEHKEDDPLRLHYCKLAMNEVCKLLDDSGFGMMMESGSSSTVLQVKAHILFLEGKYEESLDLMSEVVQQYDNRGIVDMVAWLEALFIMSKAHRKLDQFQEALRVSRKALKKLDDPNQHVKWFRNFSHEVMICFYETGMFEDAIAIGEGVVAMNRHYEGIYTPIALSHNALGNLDACIDVFRQAVLYEMPWDLDIVSAQREQLAYYEKKKKERKEMV